MTNQPDQSFSNASVSNERRVSYYGLVAAQFSLSSLFSAEVTGPIFTKLFHDVQALVAILSRTNYTAILHSVLERHTKE